MKFFIAWEHYSKQWGLLEKGYHFLEVNDPFMIDIELSGYIQQLAESKGVTQKHIVPVSCQPMPSMREENEQWRPTNSEGAEFDPLFKDAVAFVLAKQRASISGIQRQFRIGYARASRIVEQMESQGLVSKPDTMSGNREVL